VADYGVNIAVAVKNSQAITKLSRDAKTLSGQIDNVNKNIEDYANLVGKAVVNSTANFSKALQDAAENLNKVALNGDKATRAARDFLDAQLLNNEALEEQKRLLREVFLAGKPLQATPFGPQPFSPQKQLADEGKTRARLLAIQADKESGLRQERFQATSDFLNKMHSLEISLGKKANSIEIDNIIKEFEIKERLEKEAFDNARKLDIEQGKDFDRRYKARMKQRDEDDERRARLAKRQREEIMLTGQTSPIGGAVGIPGSPAALRAAERAQRIRSAQSSALIGGAFPLLFGQGLGASIGGAAGGFGGGMVGGEFGFGLSLIGTQIGSMFDKLASKAATLGAALNSSTADIDAVVESLGAVAGPTENAINRLRELEGEQVALAEATELLANIVGDEGVTALKGFGDAATQFSNQLTIFTTSVLAEAARLLQGPLGFFEDRLEEQNLLRQAQKNKSPEMVLLQTQLSKAFPHQRFEIENEIIELQRTQNEEVTKNVRLRAESARQGNNNIAILHAENNILKLNSDLTNEQVVREKERVLQLQQENEQQKIYADYASNAINLTQMREKIAENEREHENKRQSLANSVAKALEAQSKAKDRLTAKTDRQNQREQKAADREQKAIDRANKALDKINLTYTDRLALQEASTELEAELLKIDQDREGVLRRINELREKGDPAKADAAEASARAFFTAEGSGIFGNLGNIADMPSFASSIEMSNSLLLTQEEQIQKLVEKYPLLGQAADAAANMMTFGIMSFVDGTKTAEEVFADFLRSIADMLFRTAQQMIAQYIILGVARAFGLGVTPSFDYSGMDLSGSQFGPGALGGFPIPDGRILAGRANGGSVSSGRSYLVGERGPELFVPGAQGNIVPNNAMGGANVTVNVDASGSQAQGDSQRGKQLGAAIGAAVQAELIKQKRPGGLLAS